MVKSIKDVHHFVSFAAKQLKLSKLPHIRFVGHEEDGKQTFGHSKGAEVVVRTTDRHPIDVMRTLAHELTHFKQGNIKASEQSKEDNANAVAGRVMRAYDTKYPKAFKDNPIHVAEDGSTMSTGAAVVGTGNDSANMTWAPQRKRNLRDIIKRKTLNDVNVSVN